MSAPEPVVALDRVSKRYGTQPVLREVSFTVDAGSFTAIVGRSGSGKSTLLHLIGGLDRGYDGRLAVLGTDLAALDDAALSRFRGERVGFVFQAFNLLDHLTCAENVALPSFFAHGAAPGGALDRAREALDRVGLVDKAGVLPSRLSGGQKQRVAIARALFRRPQLLLADEPTGNLDSETGAQIIDLFHDLVAGGLTLVIVTHEERVSRAASRVIRIEDGRLVAGADAAPEEARP